MKTSRLLLFVSAFLLLASCSKKSAEEFNSDINLYREYINGYSSGLISAHSDIQVQLAFPKPDWKPGQEIDKDIYSISPDVDGKVLYLEDNTVAFQPSKPLKQDTEYQVTLHLSKLIDLPSDLKDFNFTVKTLEQDFLVTSQDLQSYSRDLQYLNMELKSSDKLDAAIAQKLVTAEQQGKKLPIRFDQKQGLATEFHFVIDSIRRQAEDSKIKISWNGKPYNINREGSDEFVIPGKDDFKVVGMEAETGDNQSLLINFSDPLKKDQNFAGLVSIENTDKLKYSVDGNMLKVFFDKPLKGTYLVEVFQGIESEDGYKTKTTFSTKVLFEQPKPEVQFLKSGTILPSSSNLKLNFQAVNLSAVDVKVYRVFENNILQFLQDNDLNGNYIRKVALPIAKKKIVLNTDKMADYTKWNTYALDLSTLIKPQPGAIYRVELYIKRSYSLYKCEGGETPAAEEADDSDDDMDGYTPSQYGDDYYDDEEYYYDDYNWSERDDPCSNSYYYNKKIATNVLASDLGVIAKRGDNGNYFFAVTSITSTNPVAGAKVELYNYQQQKIASAQTDADGTVSLTPEKYQAFFAVVKKDNNTTYVKLADGNSLSVSNFDVDGTELQKGLKGYIYGERGVWRPGDTLFLGFILNDRAAKLPSSHPIKLKLNDPNGKTVYQAVQPSAAANHYKFVVPTDQNAITGNWEAIISVGGARFYKSIKIETIKPNRLKIKNSFSGTTIYGSKPNKGTVQVTWLHGAIAKGLKVEMQAKFMNQVTTFKGYKNYIFNDPARDFSTQEVNMFSGKTDDNGMANVTLQPKLESEAPGMLKTAIITKAYENGGDFSTDVVTASYSPYETYVGLKMPEPNKYGMLETGKNNRFDVATVTEEGKPKPNRKLQVRVYRVTWRWWWDAQNGVSSYSSAMANTPYYSKDIVTDANGKASFTMNVDEDEWGRFLVRVTDTEGGHSAGDTVLIDWPYWSGRTKNNGGEEASMLMFTTDKQKYAVGEKATISFPSSEGSRALISLENGSQVLKTYWAETKKGETQVQIPVTANMAPNVYVNVTLIQPHASTKNDSPIRMYGIVPIDIVDKSTILEPQISMPEVLRPEQKATIKVSEKTGKPMTYTLAIVDDGLLDLTRFKTPNAWDSFFAKEALGVKTWDIYDEVIGAYGGKVNQVFSIGGDEDLGGGKAKKANRFKPVVIYLGPYKLAKGQTQSHTVKLPKYVGSVRTMVVAANDDADAYGSAEKTTPVKSPLMLLASLPRKVSPGEKVTLPVTVFAMEDKVKDVTVQVKTNSGLKVTGSAQQQVSFDRPDEKLVYFDLEVPNTTGIGKVSISASSGSEKAGYDVELDVTNPNPVTENFKELVVDPGSSGTINWDAFGVEGSNRARLEVSSFPPIDFNRRLDYLIRYPHGCLEQVTSSAFPQLYLTDIADIDQARKQKIQRNVTAAIQRLAGYQVANGGFAYWPGEMTPDDWGSSYVGHFFLEAERKGYTLPLNAKKQWLDYQKKQARLWRYNEGYHNDFAQAYRLYTLALAGEADLSSMNRLRETAGISNESKLRLAAAYALAGQKNTGLELLNKSSYDVDYYGYHYYYYYGSAERNRAMALETLLLLGEKQKAFDVATKLAKKMSSDMWMSTQTTAYCLYSMSKFADGNGLKGIDMEYVKEGSKEAVKTAKTFADRVLSVSTHNAVTIKNNKQSTLFAKVIYSGILPVGQEQTAQRGLSVSTVYKDRAGKVIDVSALPQATEFIAEVSVTNVKGEYVDNVALTQIIPSGWEIVNTRFTDFGDFAENNVEYTDIRDDRTNFYFALKAHETKTFRVLLNASYPGRYYLPGAQCEAMYDNSFLARTKGQWVEVVKGQ